MTTEKREQYVADRASFREADIGVSRSEQDAQTILGTTEDGLLQLDATDPGDIFSSYSKPTRNLQPMLDYLRTEFANRGVIYIPTKPGGGEWATSRQFTFQNSSDSEFLPRIVGVGNPRIATSTDGNYLFGFVDNQEKAGIRGGIHNLQIRCIGDPALDRFIDVGESRQFSVRGCVFETAGLESEAVQWRSPNGGGSPYGRFINNFIRGGNSDGLVIGAAGGNQVNHTRVAGNTISAGNPGTGRQAILIRGQDNRILSDNDITSADTGIKVLGNRNLIHSVRFEKPGTNVTVTVSMGANAEDNSVYLRSPGDANNADTPSGVRTTINGWGRNDGDPNTTGDWNGSGYPGAAVIDTTNNNGYVYRGGSWNAL